jgi:RNA polymerase sigma-70 factor
VCSAASHPPLLSDAFCRALARRLPEGAEPEADARLEARLRRSFESARSAWPGVALEAREFARALADRVRPTEWRSDLEALRTDALYLTTACVNGDVAAVGALLVRVLPSVESMVRKRNYPPHVVDEVFARLRERLLFTYRARAPLLTRYGGRGALEGWLLRTACRDASKMASREYKQRAPLDELLERTIAGDDPETMFVRRVYAAEFRAALTRALERLRAPERRLLRQALIEGRSSLEIARGNRVHRVTVNRWLADIRAEVLASVEAAIGPRLRLSRLEIRRLAELVGPDLDVSVTRILGRDED